MHSRSVSLFLKAFAPGLSLPPEKAQELRQAAGWPLRTSCAVRAPPGGRLSSARATCRPGDTPTSCRPWSTERRGRRSATGTAGAREDSAGARPWLHAQTRKGACESSEPRSGECDAEDSSVSGPLRLSFLICKTEMTGPSSKGACVRLAHRGFSWWPCPAAHCKKSSGHSEEGAWLLDAEKPQGDWPTAQDTILLGIRQNCTFIF